jgi:hypothetical protein
MKRRLWTGVWLAALGLGLGAPAVEAQVLGTFSWQLQPFCNVVTATIVQQGAQYTVDGYDDQCGAAQRAPLVGLAILNPDGTVGFGLHVVTVPGGRSVEIDARISPATLGGAWRDSVGNAGTFAFGAHSGGSPRPLPFVAGRIVPSGTTIVGEAMFDAHSGTTNSDALYVPLGAIAPVELTDQLVNFAPSSLAHDDDALCTGTVENPTAPPGRVCIYIGAQGGIQSNSMGGWQARLRTVGFTIFWNPLAGVQDEFLHITWAYRAP